MYVRSRAYLHEPKGRENGNPCRTPRPTKEWDNALRGGGQAIGAVAKWVCWCGRPMVGEVAGCVGVVAVWLVRLLGGWCGCWVCWRGCWVVGVVAGWFVLVHAKGCETKVRCKKDSESTINTPKRPCFQPANFGMRVPRLRLQCFLHRTLLWCLCTRRVAKQKFDTKHILNVQETPPNALVSNPEMLKVSAKAQIAMFLAPGFVVVLVRAVGGR